MTKISNFVAYVAAFEKAYVEDDWSTIESMFTEDATYSINLAPPMGGRLEGRGAIMAYFKAVLDGFDRRFESREITILDGPHEQGDEIHFRGRATYSSPGIEDLQFEFAETFRFDQDRICSIEDHYDQAVMETTDKYLAKYGERLGIPHQ